LIAALLLAALAGWIVPAKTAAQPIQKFSVLDKQIELAKESVIYKTDGQINDDPQPRSLELAKPVLANKTNKTRRKLDREKIPIGRDYSSAEVEALIRDYALRYNVSPELPLRIAYCESGYNRNSKNRHSSASGVYQYLASTWRNTEAGRNGVSVFDADANVRTAVQYIATKGTSPWNASRSCWS
jgi:hypothetical protein